MLRTFHLHGVVGERFGRTFRMDCGTVAQGLRGFGLQVPGFLDAIRAGEFRVARAVNGTQGFYFFDETTVGMKLGRATDVHLIPVLAGAKRRGLGKVLVGLAIAATAVFSAPAAAKGGFLGHNLGAGVFGSSITYGAFATLGAAMVLGGVAQMLSPAPEASNYSSRSDEKPSFLSNGAVNVNAQGVAVPLVIGRFRVGSVTISAGMRTEEVVA